MKGRGREAYEKFIEQKVGKDYTKYLIAIEDALDTIWGISEQIQNTKLFIKKELKQNLAMQFETINVLSKHILEKRISKLGENPDITELASIALEKKKRDKNLLDSIKEFKWKLPIGFKINLEVNMLEEAIEINVDKNQLENEIAKLEEQEKTKQDSAIQYDNQSLVNRLIQLAQNYDISKFPTKDRIELLICKKMGALKRKFQNRNIPLFQEDATTLMQERRNNFIDRINGNYRVVENVNSIKNKTRAIAKKKEKDENIR